MIAPLKLDAKKRSQQKFAAVRYEMDALVRSASVRLPHAHEKATSATFAARSRHEKISVWFGCQQLPQYLRAENTPLPDVDAKRTAASSLPRVHTKRRTAAVFDSRSRFERSSRRRPG
jgi:hypothetical protein